MKFDGTITIQAPRQEVWEFLTNPHAVSMCVPGLESLKVVQPDTAFQAAARLSLGTVRVIFNLNVEWTALDAPSHAAMTAHGTTPIGDSTTDITSTLTLSDGPDQSTTLTWQAEIAVVGKIASLAARLMPVITHQLTEEFFECVRGRIEKDDAHAVRMRESSDVARALETARDQAQSDGDPPPDTPIP